MTNKQTATSNIVNALIWAAIILAASYLIKDEKVASTMLFVLIGGFVATSSLISGSGASLREEVSCMMRRLRRLFGKSDAPSGG